IRKDIVESPYKIRDLGIQVIVEPPEQATDGSANVEQDITDILSTIIRTTIDTSDVDGELTDQQINSKIAVSFQELLGKQDNHSLEHQQSQFPFWGYLVIGILVLIIIVLLIFVLRKKEDHEFEFDDDYDLKGREQEQTVIPDLMEHQQETEDTIRRKQVEKMAKERPDEFAKLLRTWLSQD